MIREVRESDAKRIAGIYNYYIEKTIITFEKDLVGEEDIKQRIRNITEKGFPYIIYEKDNEVIGYAYLNNWRSRAAYDITLETSIYFDHQMLGLGLGKLLYAELIEQAKIINLHSLIGVISLPNIASQKLHEKLGFQLVGNFKESGTKFGKLINVEFWQLML